MAEESVVALADVADERRERVRPVDVRGDVPYVGLEHLDTDTSIVSRWGAATDVDSLKSRFEVGDTLFGKLRPYLKKVAQSRRSGICSTDILVFRPKDKELLDPRFLYYVLSSDDLLRYAVKRSVGTRMPRVASEALGAFRFALPPIAEQRHMVRILDGAEDALAAGEAFARALDQLRRSLSEREFARLSSDCAPASFSDLGTVARGGSFPRAEQGSSKGDHPVFKVADMNTPGNERELRLAGNWVTEEQRDRLRMKLWPAGTVVFPRVGAALAGNRRRLLVMPSVLDDNMFGLSPSASLDSYFVMLWLERVDMAGIAQQGAVPSINAKMLATLECPLPDERTQQALAQLFRSLDATAAAASRRNMALRNARHGLRRKLFADGVSGGAETTISAQLVA